MLNPKLTTHQYYLKLILTTSHLDSHGTTDILPEMLLGVQTGNGTPHDEYNIRGIAHARTNRKDDIFVQRRLPRKRIVKNVPIFTIFEIVAILCQNTKQKLIWIIFQS